MSASLSRMGARLEAGRRVLLGLAVSVTACATGDGAKGRLVPLDIPKETLDRSYAPKKLALIVGIRRFDESQWNTLRYTEKDADDLAAVLRDPARGAFDK